MMATTTKPRDRVGERYGRLLVLSEGERFPNKAKNRTWNVICDCGTQKRVRGTQLAGGATRSCGCLRLELVSKKRVDPLELFIKEKLKNYRNSAKQRGLEFKLTLEQVANLIRAECVCCGHPGRNEYRSAHKNLPSVFCYNGIDRINNDLGYAIENVRTYCCYCNQAKQAKTEAEWQGWIQRIVEKHGT